MFRGLVFFFLAFSQASYAKYWDCTDAWQRCSNSISYWTSQGRQVQGCYQASVYEVRYAYQSSDGPMIGSGDYCEQKPYRCTMPQVKVGETSDGDDRCECPAGTTSMSYIPEHRIGNCSTNNGVQTCCVHDSCEDGYKFDSQTNQCVLDAPVCGTGYKPNPYYDQNNPTESQACLLDVQCPAGTEKIAAIETQPGLNFFGTMPNPRFPNRTGYCNDNYCCVGVNPRPLPSGQNYCAQGSAVGFTDGTDYFAEDSKSGGCTCPPNAVHESQGQFQQALQSWSGASFYNKNQSLAPIVCDYTKPPSDGTSLDSLGLPTESAWSGKYDACAQYKDKGRTYDLCINMDQSMRDWIDNNVDCGAKKGLECISSKMKDVFSHCHVVDGVVTCDQKYSPPEGVTLPEPVIAKSDSHGFPSKEIDDMFDTTGMDPTSNAPSFGSKGSSKPPSLSPKPVTPPKIEPPKPSQKGSVALSSPKDQKFADVWDSKLLTDQRAYYGKMIDDFLKLTDKFKLPSIGGDLPCYSFPMPEILFPDKLMKFCFVEHPYIDVLDMLKVLFTFLTYLLPVIIFIRN